MTTMCDNFWSNTKKNENTGCIEWIRGLNDRGYGMLRVSTGKSMKAHRFAWELVNGKIPDGKMVLHKCDNPPCCNPEHLFLGTQKDNLEDMTRKGRRWPGNPERFGPQDGENNNRSKLKKENVLEIKHLLREGKKSHGEIAKKFNVSRVTITLINTKKLWKDV